MRLRWVTTKAMFSLWQALMAANDPQRGLFLRRLVPILDDLRNSAIEEMKVIRLKTND
jgi:hypothetical protein